jgi:nitrile hydratase accessory protein
VEQLVCDLPGGRPGDALPFDKPWEIRAFAIAIAVYHARQFAWSEFQRELVRSIKSWEDEAASPDANAWSYYEHWLVALEAILIRSGLVSEGALDNRTHDVLAIPSSRDHHEAHTEPIAVDPAHHPRN